MWYRIDYSGSYILGKSAITSEHVMVWKAIMTVEVVVPRSLPDFISQPCSPRLRDKIWKWPGDEASTGLNEAGTDAKQ